MKTLVLKSFLLAASLIFINQVNATSLKKGPKKGVFGAVSATSEAETPVLEITNDSAWLFDKMDDPLFKKDDSVNAELQRYVKPFFDFIETSLDMDIEDLEELHIMNSLGSKILSFDDLSVSNSALGLLPDGNYHLVFEFKDETHNTILIKN